MYNITNETDVGNIFISLSQQVPILFPMLLFFMFMVVAGAGIFATERRTGYTNIPMWFAISGLVTTTSAFILFLVDGLIPLIAVVITTTITIGFVVLFILTDERG